MASKKPNPGGQPLKFKTNEDLQEKIDAYFSMCEEQKRPYTITGLAIALDTSRETLLNYEKRDGYFGTITRAKQRIHNFAEESLWMPKVSTGVIFNLKNNWGWKDKSEHDVTSDGEKLSGMVFLPQKES